MKNRLNISKAFITVVAFNIIQIAAVIGIVIYDSMKNYSTVFKIRSDSMVLLLCVIASSVILNSIIAIRDRIVLLKADSQYELIKDTLTQVENLNNTLRAQRHDFMNHLQVVYGLLEMEEYRDVKEYIEKVYADIQKVGKALRTANPAVNALLQAKTLSAEKRGIVTHLNVTTRLSDLKMPDWELCRILGNIIDNAIYALNGKDGERILSIEMSEDLKSYYFRIKDNGQAIPESMLKKIFQPGFTTKGEHGEGMGLYIADGLMKEHNGDLQAYSSENETVFEGRIPK